MPPQGKFCHTAGRYDASYPLYRGVIFSLFFLLIIFIPSADNLFSQACLKGLIPLLMKKETEKSWSFE